jgi:hypothetical protein
MELEDCIFHLFLMRIFYSENFYELSTWADHLIPGLIFFPGNYNT